MNATATYRVKLREAHTVCEYLVDAASRDEAWRLVQHQRAELAPDLIIDYPATVYWAAEHDESGTR